MSDREQFEDWAEEKGHDVLRDPAWSNRDYQSIPCEDAWLCWQASRRAALEEAVRVTAQAQTTSHACDAIRALAKETNNG